MWTQDRTWQRYVALGDSFTEGLMDASSADPDVYVGWADRLAARLARRNTEAGLDFGYANLAVRGRLLADIAGPQLEAALDLTPDLVSISAGGNDLLRPRVSILEVADGLEAAVARLRETGADVLMVSAPDIGWAPLVGRVNPRMAELTAHVWGIAQRHGARVVDLWTSRDLQDARMWAPDRIHFSTRGHRLVADQAAWTLGFDVEGADHTLPPAQPLTRLGTLAANREWAAEHLAPWIRRHLTGRSSGDGRTAKRPRVEAVDLQTFVPSVEPAAGAEVAAAAARAVAATTAGRAADAGAATAADAAADAAAATAADAAARTSGRPASAPDEQA